MQIIKSLLLAGLLMFGGYANAQVPVTDAASIAKNIANQAETMRQWASQYQQMQSQYQQMQQQYSALTGSRNMGEIFNNPALRDYLPKDWQGVYDSVRTGGYNGLSSSASGIYDQNKVYDACASLTLADARTACQAAAVKPSQDKAFATDAYAAAKSRMDQIDSLMRQINQTQDPKAIGELQGRIAAEQAMIGNEQTKLQLFQMMTQAEDKLQQQRQHEINAKLNARRGYSPLKPVEF
ncbi:P-type DNA transfer protein VirB5 [Xanthomonas arboricola pv. juglandis]|uniref:P-type DNA transfer protein VirB5 n=1 Tax=Xanthomonas TaxID=338 RepID=UPI000E5C579B|nr:P-type DNA transfer protein VirB5 [Xanthomonas sp. CPBF 426]CAD1798223.1 P-type DNA transfer protein VirB5 [Xanthomonas sp. CPBF 426]SYZ52417.1 P-type DNA transfer protein VirB5 [Xanthomonas arboricola pv. juglandis]